MSARYFFATCLLVSACAARPTSPPDPCTGTRFDLDAVDPRCFVAYDAEARVSLRDLRFELRDARVASGERASFTLEVTNASAAPLELGVPGDCLAWEAIAIAPDGARSFETECGGLCGRSGEMPRVTLAPGGVATKRIDFEAVRTRIHGDDCAIEKAPLPPGPYALAIALPWKGSAAVEMELLVSASR